jgi:DNA-binding NtrC family response regulator
VDRSKVLIIDDEEELVTTLLERLQMRGLPAEGVLNGKDGLRRLTEGGFDVVVLDLMIPGFSGQQVLQAIREKFPAVRVLLITGHGADPESEAQLPPGAWDILLKPFRIETMIEKIAELRGNHSLPDGEADQGKLT